MNSHIVVVAPRSSYKITQALAFHSRTVHARKKRTSVFALSVQMSLRVWHSLLKHLIWISKNIQKHTKKDWFLDSCDSLGAKRPAAQSLWKCILLTPRFCRTLKKTVLTPAEILYSVPSSQCRTPSSSTHLVHLRAANQLGARDIHPQNSQILMEMNGTCPCPTNLQPCWNQYFGRMRWAMLSMYEINKA